jgi:6-phosphogluconate dehydrogenase
MRVRLSFERTLIAFLLQLLIVASFSTPSLQSISTTESPAEPPKMSCEVGLYGLAVMGQNFALNMADHGFRVCVGNRSPAKVASTVQRAEAEGINTAEKTMMVGSTSPQDFCQQIAQPRMIVLLVQAGQAVDDTIAALVPHLSPGDIIIDGGNEWYPNQIRRSQSLAERDIQFMAMGVSGGEAGARTGPSLMPGGPREAYDKIAPILKKCAAQVQGEPCTGYCGPIGAGNYVKMVHNGIEYGDMQLIGEVYDLCKVSQLWCMLASLLCLLCKRVYLFLLACLPL